MDNQVPQEIQKFHDTIQKSINCINNHSNTNPISKIRILMDRKNEIIKIIDDFINGRSKIQITIHGQVNSGKSTFLNALIGYIILPTGTQDTTRCIVQLIPNQQLNEGEFKYDGQTCNASQIYQKLDEANKQQQQQIQKKEIILKLKGLEIDKQLEKNLIFNDRPGTDVDRSNDQSISDEKLNEQLIRDLIDNIPFLNLYIVTKDDIAKQSTINIYQKYEEAYKTYKKKQIKREKQFIDKINSLKSQDQNIQQLKQTNETNEIKQNSIMIVNKKDQYGNQPEMDTVKDQQKESFGDISFVSSQKELEIQVLKNLNENIIDKSSFEKLLKDDRFKKKCVKKTKLNESQLLDGQNISTILDRRDKIIDMIKDELIDTGFENLKKNILTQITNLSQQFLEKYCDQYNRIGQIEQYFTNIFQIKVQQGMDRDMYEQHKKNYEDHKKKYSKDFETAKKTFKKNMNEQLDKFISNLKSSDQKDKEQDVKTKFSDKLNQIIKTFQSDQKKKMEKLRNDDFSKFKQELNVLEDVQNQIEKKYKDCKKLIMERYDILKRHWFTDKIVNIFKYVWSWVTWNQYQTQGKSIDELKDHIQKIIEIVENQEDKKFKNFQNLISDLYTELDKIII